LITSLSRLFQDLPKQKVVPQGIQERLAASAKADFAALWGAVKDEAEELAHGATQLLEARGVAEAQALRKILEAQKQRIEGSLNNKQLSLFSTLSKDEQKQWENDREHMRARLDAIAEELEREPREIEALYQVSLQRLEPVGLVYLYPTTRLG